MNDEGTTPPELDLDFDEISRTARMGDDVWNFWVKHWEWMARVLPHRSDEAEVTLQIGKPATSKKLNAVLDEMQMELPVEFRVVLSNHCAKLEFLWSCFDADQSPLPEPLQGLDCGGNKPIWSIQNMGKYALLAARNGEVSEELDGADGMQGRLPFMDDGSGDLFAFDMRNGNENCPIVYLSHENDSSVHEKTLGANFIDFMTRWSYLGCPGFSYYAMEPFINQESGRFDTNGDMAQRWRHWLANGS